MSKFIYTYFLTVPVFFLVDMLWLGVLAKGFYRRQLANFLGEGFNWTAAIIFYLLFIVGIIIFAVWPGVEKNSLIRTIVFAALFGFFTYATYDLSNLATLKGWPITVVIVDIIWGVVISTITAIVGFYIYQALK